MNSSLTPDELKTIDTSLADAIEEKAKTLKEEKEGIKSCYWVNVEVEPNSDSLFLSADNGFDVSDCIEVSDDTLKEKICMVMYN